MKTYLFPIYFFALMMISCQSNAQTTYTIETNLGNIQVKLYEQTPQHKANFEKLAAEQFFDNVLFHRIIAGFMIQTGDGRTKPTPVVEPNYTVPAEFVPGYFHKKGALAAARTGDHVNPEKRSSPTQFYIVQGRIFSDEELDQIEMQNQITFTEYQRDIYKTIGGTPFLDQSYTVFGEVIKGMDVVDAIAALPTGARDVPQVDIRILRVVKN